MKLVYESDTVLAKLDDAGWLEFTVGDQKNVTYQDLLETAQAVLKLGIPKIRVLIVRTFRYSTAKDIILSDLQSIDGLSLEKVAYFAPDLFAKTAAEIESVTALRNIPTRVFGKRDEAIQWLTAGGNSQRF